MVFNLLLQGLGLLLKTGMKAASYRDAAFKKRLQERNVSLEVRLARSNRSGTLVLRKGRLSTTRKRCAGPPDLLIELRDAGTAARNLLKLKPRDLVDALHREIASGRVGIEGNVASTVWLLLTLRQMLVVLSGSEWKQPLSKGARAIRP